MLLTFSILSVQSFDPATGQSSRPLTRQPTFDQEILAEPAEALRDLLHPAQRSSWSACIRCIPFLVYPDQPHRCNRPFWGEHIGGVTVGNQTLYLLRCLLRTKCAFQLCQAQLDSLVLKNNADFYQPYVFGKHDCWNLRAPCTES